MTYSEAIKTAKRTAIITNEVIFVFRYKKHWWQRYKYSYIPQFSFSILCRYHLFTKFLTITPSGIIVQ